MATDWKLRHYDAIHDPHGLEVIGEMVMAWVQYGEEHLFAYESTLSEDYVLGPAWAKIGEGLLTLLNGDLGRLDGGSLDGLIRSAMETQGWNPDTMEISPDVRTQEEIDSDNAYEMGL